MKKLNFEDFTENQLTGNQKINIVGGQPPAPQNGLDEDGNPINPPGNGSPEHPSNPPKIAFILSVINP